MADFDQTARTIFDLDPDPLFAWLASKAKKVFKFREWFRERMPPRHDTDERIGDQVAIFDENDTTRYLFLVESQTLPDADKLDVTFEHAASLRSRARWGPDRENKYRILTAIIHLTGRLDEESLEMLTPSGHGSLHRPVIWNVADEHASAVLDQLESQHRHPTFLHWLPLMQGGGDETIITRCRALAETLVTDSLKRANLVYSVHEFAELARCYLTWEHHLKGWNMSDSIVATRMKKLASCKDNARISSRCWTPNSPVEQPPMSGR